MKLHLDIKTLIFISLTASTTFMFLSHPISLMLLIIFQTMAVCLMAWLMISSSYLSYILFLIFMGGLMVLFIYISSLASNEKFSLNYNNSVYIMALIYFWLIFLFYYTDEQLSFLSCSESTGMIFKIFSLSLSTPSIMTFLYLFLTLIVAVKLTSYIEGPMRSKTNT
uniref:NADH-ubiquinone oxidoreductase chain 6 n=1 Tax=Novacerus sp. FZ-2019 TaxID=2585224 RepID=A0A6H0EWT6_9HEXA|nr:NADH dehydrogenase subunit 6 [Novacerus sp. FZ-2019]